MWGGDLNIVNIVIRGRPITKKNHQRIIHNKRTGYPQIIQSKAYRQYERDALWQLKLYRGPKFME